ncbi:MAG TPA: DUF1214 domain-containing protein [Acidimicrobiales bacterium]
MGQDLGTGTGTDDVLRRAWGGLVAEIERGFDLLVETDVEAGVEAGGTGGRDDVDAAEGFRHLLRMVDVCVALDVEHGDRNRPSLFPLITPTRKLYFDNPDVRYEIARIRGSASYRLHGRRGDAAYVTVAVYGTLNGGRMISSIGGPDLAPDADGTIDLRLGGAPPPGGRPWLPLDADADAVVVRQYFTTRTSRSPARLRIDPTVPPGPREPLGEAGLAYDLVTARGKLALGVRLAAALDRTGRRHHGAAVLAPTGEDIATPFGAPFCAYVPVWFRLEADEALVVEGPAPTAPYWGAHLANRWGESLDDGDTPVARTLATTELDADGRYRYVVSHRPVDHPNWLDASGHREGFLILRCLHGDAPGLPEARVVPVATFAPPDREASWRGAPRLPRLDLDGWAALVGARDALVGALRRAADHVDATAGRGVERATAYRSIARTFAEGRELLVEQAFPCRCGSVVVADAGPLTSEVLADRVHALARAVEHAASARVGACPS